MILLITNTGKLFKFITNLNYFVKKGGHVGWFENNLRPKRVFFFKNFHKINYFF